MKKALISILIVLLLIFAYVMVTKSINIGPLEIDSVNDIKTASNKLDEDMNKADELSEKTYPEEKSALEDAIKSLKISKKEYENKTKNTAEEITLGDVEIKTYKIHYLWTILGNYRKDRGLRSLNLDLASTETKDVYDLRFTLIGTYSSITEFLYDIEEDEKLKFSPKSFILTSDLSSTTTTNKSTNTIGNTNNNTSNTNSTTLKNDGVNLKATFTVENIGVTLD